MKNIFFLFMVAMLTIAASCNKENPEPEPQLSCGEPRPECLDCEWNVFRCKINGEDWCANCKGDPIFGCDPVDCQFYPDDDWLVIRGGDDINNNGISFSSSIIELNKNLDFFRKTGLFNKSTNSNDCILYDLDTLSKPYINISIIDSSSKLIEGTFEFTAYNECQDTVRITDGYFKLTYRP